jgi:hypothetical protein
MPTIQQAQIAAGKDGFVGRQGVERFDNPELSVFEAMAEQYVKEFADNATQRLNADNSSHTGKLEESIRYETTDGRYNKDLRIYVLEYYKFVDKGVQGFINKSINSPYKFRGTWVSKSHREAILKWIREGRKKIVVRDVQKYGKTRQESKAIDPAKRQERLAYLIARKSKREGIKGTGFWTKAFEETFKDFGVQMAKALGEDIRIDLRAIVNEVKKKR